MFISIIIPVYNGEKTINRTLDSLIQQTCNEFEVIVIDDGSTDKTKDILKNYKALFKNANRQIKIINQENSGVSVARNRGIIEARGKYVAFLDSDDYLSPSMVQVVFDCTNQMNYDYVIYGFYALENNEQKELDYYKAYTMNGQLELKEKLNELLPTRILNSPCNKLYKNELLQKYSIRFNRNLSLGEDLNFNLKYYFKICNLKIIEDRLYVIDKSNSYLSIKYRENYYKDRISALREMKETFRKNGMDEEVFNWLYVKLVYACIFNIFRSESSLSRNEKVRFLEKILCEAEVKVALESFKPSNIYQKVLLVILKSNKVNFIILSANIFHKFKRFAPMSLRKLSV